MSRKLHILALNDKKSIIGKKVTLKNYTIPDRIEYGKEYTVKDVITGNHTTILYFEELPKRSYSKYAKREVLNAFRASDFKLVEGEE